MAKSYRWAIPAATVLALFLLASGAMAQGPASPVRTAAPARNAPMIVLLDVKRVFAGYNTLLRNKADLEASMEQADATLRAEQENIRRLAEQIKEHKIGSVDYKRRELEINRRATELKVTAKQQQEQFIMADVQMLHQAYTEMQRVVYTYCTTNGIAIVLSMQGEGVKFDPTKPQTIQIILGKPLIYHHPNLDITQIILNELNRSSMAPRTSPGTNPVSRVPTRPGVGAYPR